MKTQFSFYNLTMGVSMAVLLISCNDKNDPIESIKDSANESAQLVQMNGVWNGSCERSDLIQMATKEQYDFDSQKKEFTRTKTIFSDSNCQNTVGEVKYTGDFLIARVAGVAEIRDLDLHYIQMVVKLNDEATANIFSASNFCDQEVWRSGAETIMTNIDSEKCFVSKIPQTYYGRVSVEDNKLFLSSDMGTSPENRALEVDHGIVFLD